ncbi:Maintenance of telomere capping protein 6 [Frankliniella fusca]|uniref:Maintenance of telomere capping protein 6 n=1 Tax=Frankliniella fusca TaxID=407009 RepID=A0AAE1LF03_9NEOP|nr:Maintenance of telomere capping protein 6 [Frankliniella fusca]
MPSTGPRRGPEDRVFSKLWCSSDASINAWQCRFSRVGDSCSAQPIPVGAVAPPGVSLRVFWESEMRQSSSHHLNGFVENYQKYSKSRVGGMVREVRAQLCCYLWLATLNLPSHLIYQISTYLIDESRLLRLGVEPRTFGFRTRDSTTELRSKVDHFAYLQAFDAKQSKNLRQQSGNLGNPKNLQRALLENESVLVDLSRNAVHNTFFKKLKDPLLPWEKVKKNHVEEYVLND